MGWRLDRQDKVKMERQHYKEYKEGPHINKVFLFVWLLPAFNYPQKFLGENPHYSVLERKTVSIGKNNLLSISMFSI